MILAENKTQPYGLFYLKQIIIMFWCIWFFIAFLTNLTDFLIILGKITPPTFRSDNYSALEKVISIHHPPHFLVDILFTLDITAQGLSALLFLVAAICFWKRIYVWQSINLAFMISISLWAIFLIMEEIFIAYPYEATHIRLCVFELVSLLMIHLVPHQNEIIHDRQI